MGDTYLSPERHMQAEFAARDALVHMGFEVKRDSDGVRIDGPGFTLRARAARAARDLLRDLL